MKRTLLCVVATMLVLPMGLHARAAPDTTVDHVQVRSFDGTPLDGWIVRPARVPVGTRLPTVLWSSPYFGTTYPSGDNPALWTNDIAAYSVPVDLLVAHDYVVAIFNVRGSGNSGGCFEWFGPNEQKDQAFLVEWLAARPWSNGNVGMMGLSYHGTTPWEAAIQNPPHLRTIVVAGMVSDPYTFTHTPQGATFTAAPAFDAAFFGAVGLLPINSPSAAYTAKSIEELSQRLCRDVARFLTDDARGIVSDRSTTFWIERRLIDRFPQIRTAVLLTHGFQDLWESGHQSQESAVWQTLVRAPKIEIKGQWAHEFPNFNDVHPGWVLRDWNARLLAWFDYWLKGQGPRPDLGTVSFQDGTGAWHTSTSWPPAEDHTEVLHLAGTSLSANPSPAKVGFLDLPESPGQGELNSQPPSTGSYSDVFRLTCAESQLPDELAAGRVFMTKPLAGPALIAGNPFAYLRLSTNQPGGQVSVQLVDVSPGGQCGPIAPPDGSARPLSVGSADLRFFHGNYAAQDFPAGTPTWVRIDLTHLAEVIPAGHRLALVASRGELADRTSAPFTPHVTIDGASELVIPVLDGTFGGRAPTHSYPPRPFVPET